MDTTVAEILALRQQGEIEKAYEAARGCYARDKSTQVSSVMFWTAADMLRKHIKEAHVEEAGKIFLALKRLLNGVTDENGEMHKALQNCQRIITLSEKSKEHEKEIAEHILVGKWGERIAADFLLQKGYTLLERDWHSKHRDIDIIAQQDDCLVFVEVKTRSNRDFTEPITAINYQKLKNLRMAINHYLKYKAIDTPWRFDVITIVGALDSINPEIEHIEDFSLL